MTDEIKNKITSIKNHFIPDGYKKTKIGVIPIEWDFQKLSKFLYVNKEKNIKLEYTKNDVFSISGEKGIVNQIDFLGRSYAGESVAPYRIVYPDNIVYTKSPLKNNPYGIIKANKTNKTGIVSTLYAVYCCNNSVLPEYIEYYFELDLIINNYLYPLVNIGSKHDMKISDENVLKGYVVIPAIYEQKRIIEILSTQNKVIELKEKLIAEKQRQKKYLMQQLLTGKMRLKGFNGEWKKTKFCDMFLRLTRKNKEGNTNVLTISAQYGLINQEEFFNKSIASDDKSNYFLLYKGEFAYNKSYSSGYSFGAFKPLVRYDKGIVSPLYICFTPTDNNLCPGFYAHYFEAGLMNHEIKAIAQEGARNHGLLNISVDDFFNMNIKKPPVKEQQEITEILSTADKEIDLLQKELEQEKQKKKAVMQLLLTGIVRV